MESTYGDRDHRSLKETAIEGRKIIAKAIEDEGEDPRPRVRHRPHATAAVPARRRVQAQDADAVPDLH